MSPRETKAEVLREIRRLEQRRRLNGSSGQIGGSDSGKNCQSERVLRAYESAVQDVRSEVHTLLNLYHDAFPSASSSASSISAGLLLREDFCGTAALAREWLGVGERRWAVGVDVDANVLGVARARARGAGRGVSARLQLFHGSVLESDLVEMKGGREGSSGSSDYSATPVTTTTTNTNTNTTTNTTINTNIQSPTPIPLADIIVALNYALCYLHTHALFVCDAFGGAASRRPGYCAVRRLADGTRYVFERRRWCRDTQRIQCHLHFL